jgi:hypothetical protein
MVCVSYHICIVKMCPAVTLAYWAGRYLQVGVQGLQILKPTTQKDSLSSILTANGVYTWKKTEDLQWLDIQPKWSYKAWTIHALQTGLLEEAVLDSQAKINGFDHWYWYLKMSCVESVFSSCNIGFVFKTRKRTKKSNKTTICQNMEPYNSLSCIIIKIDQKLYQSLVKHYNQKGSQKTKC